MSREEFLAIDQALPGWDQGSVAALYWAADERVRGGKTSPAPTDDEPAPELTRLDKQFEARARAVAEHWAAKALTATDRVWLSRARQDFLADELPAHRRAMLDRHVPEWFDGRRHRRNRRLVVQPHPDVPARGLGSVSQVLPPGLGSQGALKDEIPGRSVVSPTIG